MVNLEGKVICNAFMDCDDTTCRHRVPHEHIMICEMSCTGTCVPIHVYYRVNGVPVYSVKGLDDVYHVIPEDLTPATPEFYICSSHASCPNDDCEHKQFHNKLDECETECFRLGLPNNVCGVPCREANNEEILQLFREHDDENQHIDDLLEQDDKVYSDLMDELTKPKPEKPKPVHERVKRFLNLEL